MGRIWHVYVATNKANGKRYVGKTCNPSKRFREHITSALSRRDKCTLLARAIRKHGEASFGFSVVSSHETEVAALRDEARLIRVYRSDDPALGYNLTTGGESGVLVRSAREKIAKKLRGHKVSDETRTRIGAKVRAAWVTDRADSSPVPPSS